MRCEGRFFKVFLSFLAYHNSYFLSKISHRAKNEEFEFERTLISNPNYVNNFHPCFPPHNATYLFLLNITTVTFSSERKRRRIIFVKPWKRISISSSIVSKKIIQKYFFLGCAFSILKDMKDLKSFLFRKCQFNS